MLFAAAVALVFCLLAPQPAFGQAVPNLTLGTAPGGVPVGGSKAAGYTMNLGNVNGLGVPPTTGNTVLATPIAATGAIYESPLNFTISGLPGPHTITLTGYVSSNFGAPLALQIYNCTGGGNCGSASGAYSATSLSAAAPSTFQGIVGNGTVTGNVAVRVANLSGAGAFTGAATAVVTLTATSLFNGKTDTVTLTISVNARNAMRLVLATSTVAPNCAVSNSGSNTAVSYGINLGNINGLGTPTGGCAAVTATTPPVWYSSYNLTPSFSGFATTTGTVAIAVTTPFTKAFLSPREASAAGGIVGGTLPLSFGVTNAVTLTRFVGVQVTPFSGPGAGGPDSAVLTYTLTAP